MKTLTDEEVDLIFGLLERYLSDVQEDIDNAEYKSTIEFGKSEIQDIDNALSILDKQESCSQCTNATGLLEFSDLDPCKECSLNYESHFERKLIKGEGE